MRYTARQLKTAKRKSRKIDWGMFWDEHTMYHPYRLMSKDEFKNMYNQEWPTV